MPRPKSDDPPKVNVGTRVPKDLYDWFEAVATDEQRTVSQLVLFAMREYRDRRKSQRQSPPIAPTAALSPRAGKRGRTE